MLERRRRLLFVVLSVLIFLGGGVYEAIQERRDYPQQVQSSNAAVSEAGVSAGSAQELLGRLVVKGRAPKTGYTRAQFSDGWNSLGGCDVRNYILGRDMTNVATTSSTNCTVLSGTLDDPYTAKTINFTRGKDTSDDVQIDHVVALSNAWQTGAQQLTKDQRNQLANDPLNLLAVDGPTNQNKGDSDAATWLPPNKSYRCRYVARQIAVKLKYTLWVTQAEHDAIARQLETCPGQLLPAVSNAAS